MKKYIYIYALLFMSLFPLWVYGECSQSCEIEDAPSPILVNYFTNLNTVTGNVTDALSGADTGVEGNLEGRARNMLRIFDKASFGEFYTSFDYYISTPIHSNIPDQVHRDHDMIEKEGERLISLLKTAEQRATAGVIVDTACSGVPNCELNGLSAREILSELIRNNGQILNLFRMSIADKSSLSSNTPYILVENNFISEFRRAYNQDTLNACSECGSEGGLADLTQDFSKIQESIVQGFALAENGTESWKEAFALIRGEAPGGDGNRALEKELLSSFLKEQGVKTEQADIMLENLARANAGGLSTSNPLFNSINEVKTKVGPKLESFDAAVTAGLKEISEFIDDPLAQIETIPYSYITRVRNEVRSTESISRDIATLYNEEIQYALVQDTGTQELQARIIRMHYSLVRSANILEGKIDDAEALCDKQGVGLGKCSFKKIFKLTGSYDSISN